MAAASLVAPVVAAPCTLLECAALPPPAKPECAADGGAADPAYPDAEAAAWQGAYLQTVRAALPWVDEVAASYPAVCGLADGSC